MTKKLKPNEVVGFYNRPWLRRRILNESMPHQEMEVLEEILFGIKPKTKENK